MVLLEREGELGILAEIIRRARGQTGAGCLIEGDPGTGKTSLLEQFRTDAASQDLMVLHARGVDAERGYPFGVVRQLLRPFVPAVVGGDDLGLLSGPAARAVEILDDARAVPTVDPYEHYNALYWLLVNAAERAGLAITVDDAHLADDASAGFLGFLSQRLWAHDIALCVGQRPAPRVRQLLAPELPTLEIGPLSRSASDQVVAEVVGESDTDFAKACYDVAAGNPFLLRELVEELAVEQMAPTAANAVRVRRLVPDAVRRMAVMRLAALDRTNLALVQAAAVLDEGAPLPVVAALAELPPDEVPQRIDRLITARILAPSTTEIGFLHPLVHSAIYADIPLGARAALHLRAADELRRAGAPVETVARHLLRAPPAGRAEVVAALRDAAVSARRSGDHEGAAELRQRALDEGAEDPRDELALELATDLVVTEPPRAEPLLRELVADDTAPHRSLEAALQLGRMLQFQGRFAEAAGLLEPALVRARALGRGAELRAFAEYVSVAPLAGRDVSGELDRTFEIVGDVDPASADVAELEALAALGLQLSMAGNDPRAVTLAEAAYADGRLVELAGGGAPAVSMCTGIFHTADLLDRNFEVATRALDDARGRGSPVAFAAVSYLRGAGLAHRGRVDDAIADLEAAVAGSRDGWHQYLPVAYGYLAKALADRGEPDRALARLEEVAQHSWADPLVAVFRGFRGQVRAQIGDLDGALEDLEAWGRLFPVPNPAFMGNWRSISAGVLARLGRRDEARARAEEELALLGDAAPARALGLAQRGLGLSLVREEQVEMLRQSVATLEHSPSVLDLCRARIDLGAAMRRTGQRPAAREVLRQAASDAERLGAFGLRDRAAEELVAAGGRPRRQALRGPASLTPSQFRVARLAAQGMSNRQIAEMLFVTTKGVGYHLGHVYRKLEISGRSQLAAVLGSEAAAPETGT